MKKSSILRSVALILSLTLAWGSASAATVRSGETISSNSKWINSDIIGAIDETTAVSLKDDFHTAVNRDWILYEEDQRGAFERSAELLRERKLDIAAGRTQIDPANADAVGLGSEQLAHNLDLIGTLASLSSDWEKRNELGVEPARDYLEAIDSIRTMDEMTAYLTNEHGLNLTGFSLLDIRVAADPNGSQMNMAVLSPIKEFSLGNQDIYLYLDEAGRNKRYVTEELMLHLLGRLGWSRHEIHAMLVKGLRFESRLAQWITNSLRQQTVNYLKYAKTCTMQEITDLAGRYPLTQELEAKGLAGLESYTVYETEYLRGLNKFYQPRYLDEIKAMCMLHTVQEMITLLDEEAYNHLNDTMAIAFPGSFSIEEIMNEVTLTEEELQEERMLDDYIAYYLGEVLDQVYVAAYCTPEQKTEIRGMIDLTVDFYRDMIQDVSWLSQETRDATVDKLNNMAVRCVYPDQFTDYRPLTYAGYEDEQPGTLPQAVAAIMAYKQKLACQGAGTPVDRSLWIMEDMMSTTVCNAYYAPMENSINILAGVLTEAMCPPDFTYEQKLAIIGSIIGHEITHAFDTTGYQFDKNGAQNPWWSLADKEAFDWRAKNLVKFYDSLTPYPGAMLYMGANVSGEAIADMGGMKSMLSIAAQIPDFDYEAFFTAYAQLWRVQKTLEEEKDQAMNDVHPLSFLRTNVTLQQFDEFHETFDIQPGDGMYLAPENRINVW